MFLRNHGSQEDKSTSEKQAPLLMASSAKISLTLSTRNLCLVGDAVFDL